MMLVLQDDPNQSTTFSNKALISGPKTPEGEHLFIHALSLVQKRKSGHSSNTVIEQSIRRSTAATDLGLTTLTKLAVGTLANTRVPQISSTTTPLELERL
jgi:hypothetical protein